MELGATASDNVDGDLTAAVSIDASAVDTSTLGSYEVLYDVSDSAGNAADQMIRTVIVATASHVVDFSGVPVLSYGGVQDAASVVSVEDAGGSLRITGNGWKRVAIPTIVTGDTFLGFDFSSSTEGEIHGIGFDTDNFLSEDRTFQVFGTQGWGISDYATYVSPGVTHYAIPVGQFFTGTFDYVVFANDHDIAIPDAESLFSNVQVHEVTP